MSFFHKKDSAKKSSSSAAAANTSHNDDLDSLSSSSSATYSTVAQQQQQPQSSAGTTVPPLVQYQHSSSSSLDSSSQSHPPGLKHPVVPAKPKKGILKTMSKVILLYISKLELKNKFSDTFLKFTMGGSSGGSHLPNITVKPIEINSTTAAPAASVTSTTGPSQNTVINQSVVASSPGLPLTPIKPPQSAQIPYDQCPTVQFKSVPVHLTPSTSAYDPRTDFLETSIHRWVHVPFEWLDAINLSSDEKNPGGPIFIEAPQLDEFLPGDQLIAIEEFSMIGKSPNL